MGSSGFPFPPTISHSHHRLDGGLLVAQKGSLCTPSVLSPGVYIDPDSPAATPGAGVSDPILLPSVMSPSVPPPRSPAAPVIMSLRSPLHSDSSLSPFSDPARLPSAFADTIPPPASLPTPPQDRISKLRLPSFQGLGIANPHPDEIVQNGDKIITRSIGIFPDLASDSRASAQFGVSTFAHASSSDDLCDIGSGSGSGSGQNHLSVASPLPHDLAILTPPDDLPMFDWSASDIPTPGIDPATTESGASLTEAIPQAMAASVGVAAGPTPDDSEGEEIDKWLDDAIGPISSSLDSSNLPGHSMRVLSHALPSPSIPGHSFPHIIEQLRDRLPASALMFINLLHAVPGRFNLSDLPTSPPSTPGEPLGSSNGTGEDYFTAKVFEAAVTAIDYSSPARVTAPARSAASTAGHPVQYFPLAAPSSLNLSIVERFIPPSSRNEFMNLFSLTKPSLLVDRLVELAPGNGSLVFIYPTRAGAETFCTKYLGPILDPVLRSMVVVNNFSADLSGAIGRMAAVSHMHDFDTMLRKVTELCSELQSGSTSNPQVRQRLHGDTGNFSVVYSAKKRVHLTRSVWTNWLIKQEKTRVRNAVGLHFRYTSRYVADSETTPTHLIEEIFNGVATRTYPVGQEPTGEDSKIEMGVFVIKRGK